MGDEEDRKLFVGGLPQDVTQDEIKEYFGKFGQLEKVQLKMDPTTGRSRGFAFLLFADTSSLDSAASEEHAIKGKKLTAKKADIKPGKIYVGKLPDNGVSEDEIRAYFEEFGTVTEVIRPIDKSKNNEPKNFCFVTFERERVSRKLIDQGTCSINGSRLQIKPVTPNPRDPTTMGRGGAGGMRGGRGGGYSAGGGGGWGMDAGGYGAGGYGATGWGAEASTGYGGGYGGGGGYGADASGGYGASAYGGGYGADAGGYGGGAGYGGGYGGAGGGKMMRGGRGGAPSMGARGRGGRGRPY